MAIQHTYQAQSVDDGVAFMLDDPADLPTDPAAPLTPAQKAGSLGVLTDTGLSKGINRTSNVEKDFDGADYVVVQQEYSGLFKFTMFDVGLQQAKKMLYGDQNVTFTPADATHGNRYHVQHNADQLPIKPFFFLTKSGKKRELNVVENGRVDEIGEQVYKGGESTKVEVTIRASKNSNGNYVEEYGDDGETVPGPLTVEVVATGAWRFGVGGNYSIELSETTTNADVKDAIEDIYGFTGTATVTGSTAGTYNIVLSDGGTVTVNGAATIS